MSDKKTPLYKEHILLKGQMVPFAGWSMPVQYSSIIQEHIAVRETAGLFDVSHMGEIIVQGKEALPLLEETTCNLIEAMEVGQVQYNAILNHNGGLIDDITIYKVSTDEYFICSNASNYESVYKHLVGLSSNREVKIENQSANWHQLAIQGPKAESIFQEITGLITSSINYFRFQDLELDGKKIRISRTGYTGEDGFEIYSDIETGMELWKKLIEKGTALGLLPIGLGARDTLRLEARYPLYGHELNANLTPVESGIGWIVKEKPTQFFAYDKILEQKKTGCRQQVAGFILKGRGVPRDGMEVLNSSQETIGKILSGTFSPSLRLGIGTVLLPTEYTKPGTPLLIKIRDNLVEATVHKGAFVKGSAGKK